MRQNKNNTGLKGAVTLMRADAVIFDKDGTLIDFDSVWVPVSVKAMEDVLEQLGREDIPVDEFLEAYGVHDGVTDITGVLCHGTYAQMGEVAHGILKDHGCDVACGEIVKLVADAYHSHMDGGKITLTSPDLADVLRELKKRNVKLAVVTNDNEAVTRICLSAVGIEELFDKMYSDDGSIPTKPDPARAYDFCRLTGAEKERVFMVGDTLTDMHFAKNAGIMAVGVAKNDRNRQILTPCADVVIDCAAGILALLEE